MRIKDFTLTFNGEIGEEEKINLASVLGNIIGNKIDLSVGSSKQPETEADTIEKIDNGEAKWVGPLQQHLDAVKVGAGVAALEESKNDSVRICEDCGRLVFNNRQTLHENVCVKLQNIWKTLLEHYGAPKKSCKQSGKKCR